MTTQTDQAAIQQELFNRVFARDQAQSKSSTPAIRYIVDGHTLQRHQARMVMELVDLCHAFGSVVEQGTDIANSLYWIAVHSAHPAWLLLLPAVRGSIRKTAAEPKQLKLDL